MQDPRHRILYDSLTGETKPDIQEGFHELLERLSNAHDRELRGSVDQLETEKAELEWQAEMLRSQLAKERARRASDDDQLKESWVESKTTHVTHVTIASRGQSDERAIVDLTASPNLLHIPDDDEAALRDRDPVADSERDQEAAIDNTEEKSDEEERFPPRSEYMEELGDVLDTSRPMTMNFDRLTRMPSRQLTLRFSEFAHARHPFYIASPRSRVRTAWEIMGAILICWDLFVIPLTVFCYPINGFTIAMEWITLLYWTLNVPQTLTVGYETALGTVMSPSPILTKYMKGWLIIDMVVLVPDWVIVVLSAGSDIERKTSCDSAVQGSAAVKLLRNLRLMRLMRLTRIARLKKIWQLLKERIYTLTLSIVANILTMLLLLLILCHFISCLWYTISYNSDGDDRWLVHYEMKGLRWNYLYATCLHWSLTQFTPAPIDIQPQNISERVFTISVVVSALVGFSYVVGSITGSLAQLRSLKEEESKQFWDLRVYLKKNHVEHVLAVRVQRYLQHVWQYQVSHKTYKQIKILTMLSEQLENELLFQLHSNHLTVHPLVEKLLKVSRVTAFRLAKEAVSTKHVAKDDPVFIHDEKPSHMYIVMEGQFQYKRVTSEGEVVREVVDKGEDWIAEPVLWSTNWYHLGDCNAADQSSLMLVSPQHFCKEVQRNPTAWILVTTYCKNFLKWLNSTHPDDLSDITQGDDKEVSTQLKEFMVVDDVSKLQMQLSSRSRKWKTGPLKKQSAKTMIIKTVGKIANRRGSTDPS
jgi:hypothetical protein